jgi:hypothetical protein
MISNDIMRFAIAGTGEEAIDIVQAEEYANNYVSQQIFNVLTAQAPTTDYDPEYIKSSGIDIGETVKLDPMDLRHSLAGPVVVGYAEASVAGAASQKSRVDARELLRRAIGLPSLNQLTRAIEGISVLPAPPEAYQRLLENKAGNRFDFRPLKRVMLFGRCPSVVVVISLPVNFKLQFSELEEIKAAVAELFPESVVTRYSVIIGASRHLSLTILMARSAALTDECSKLVTQFVKFSLGKDDYRNSKEIEVLMSEYLSAEIKQNSSEEEKFSGEFVKKARNFLEDFEMPSRNAQSPWAETKTVFERKFFDLVPEVDPPLPMDSLRVSFDEVMSALQFIRSARIHTRPVIEPIPFGLESDP